MKRRWTEVLLIEIVARVSKGEKIADLAKEYQVTRHRMRDVFDIGVRRLKNPSHRNHPLRSFVEGMKDFQRF